MKEIKFRAKTKTNKWVYGNYYICDRQPAIQMNFLRYFINPKTLGQYTGFKDKNGTKIFEGDIVGCFCNTQIFQVKWCDVRGGYFLDDVVMSGGSEPTPECLGNLVDTIEVIGNIFDNPELLEKVEE